MGKIKRYISKGSKQPGAALAKSVQKERGVRLMSAKNIKKTTRL